MKRRCLICKKIAQIKRHANPYLIKELHTGYVVIEEYQFYKGYVLFLCKRHVNELHELEDDFKTTFLTEMSIIAETVFSVFRPKKLNYELLGNTCPHLHWHIIPRHGNDPGINNPIWVINKAVRRNEAQKPTSQELDVVKGALQKKLDEMLIQISNGS
ncbi:HIT family protein [Candidatus Roizmanbacteria bacterium]|nr:HIT family protein [Candidatus Roizmanbacteria bacterium]